MSEAQTRSAAEETRARLRQALRNRIGSTGGWHPLSHGQEALWFLYQLAPANWAYNIVVPVGVRGELDVAALERSLQHLTNRHACLRIEFKADSGTVMQRARERHSVHLEHIDASSWSQEQWNEEIRKRAQYCFDLATSATPRFTLFRRDPGSHVLLSVIHHIVSDLWSVVIVMDELREQYAAEKSGAGAALPPLSIAYEDYVRWQRRMLEGEAGNRLWNYWREEVAGDLPPLDLPADRPRIPVRTFRGRTITRQINAGLAARLAQLAKRADTTLYTVLLAAYEVLLHRYTGQESFVVGAPTSGRQRAEFAGIVGDFVNMVPLRVDLADSLTFLELLAQARARVLGAMAHQDFPFSLMVDRLGVGRDLSRAPIFQTTFVLQKLHRFQEFSRTILPAPDEPTVPFADLILEPIALAQQDGQFDLNLEMKEDEKGRLMGAWKHAADLFNPETIARIAANYETLLGEIVAHPECRISELRLLTSDEMLEAIESGKGDNSQIPAPSVCDLFLAQADRHPRALAVVCGETALTYGELARRVNGLARRLKQLGVGPEVLVAVLLPRGLDFITMLLAIHRAGGAFLPLDPRHPLARIMDVLESSGTVLMLTSRALQANFKRAIAVEDLNDDHAGQTLQPILPESLAYVMCTSGSTGAPKGVMVEHRGMVNHVLAKLFDLAMDASCVLAQNAPPSFDVVVWQCMAPLAVGGRVVVCPDEIAEDPASLLAEVEKQGITVLQVVPSMLNAILEEATSRRTGPPALPSLRWMVPTGESLPTTLCRRWLECYPRIPVLNTYGSTECSDDQCHYRIVGLSPVDGAAAVISIGSPIQNMTAHVVDRNLAPLPLGVVGELYIGGLGVGRGYVHDPMRTAATFIPDPFDTRPGARMYRTRDMARRRADGGLDFIGRADQMIKLRGFRIEPKEIEAALCRHASISAAAVVAREHVSGERRLVAYAVASKYSAPQPARDELRNFLAASLPQYMVPAVICFVPTLPLTANGKLDQRRLPPPEWQSSAPEQFVAPRTPEEEKMASIWREVLELERVSVEEDFFAAGGDSIRSIQVVARARRSGLHISPSDIFVGRTIAALAAIAARKAMPLEVNGDLHVPVAGSGLQVADELLMLASSQVKFEGE